MTADDHFCLAFHASQEDWSVLSAVVDRLAEAMVKAAVKATWEEMMPYLTHRLGCQWFGEDTATRPRQCTCGFEDVRRRAQERI